MRFNVAPTDVMPIVGANREGEVTIKELRWGPGPVLGEGPDDRLQRRMPAEMIATLEQMKLTTANSRRVA